MAFAKGGEIRPLDECYRFPLLCSTGGCNEDFAIESYTYAPFAYADKQRKCTHEDFGGCSDISDHARRALRGEIPSTSRRTFHSVGKRERRLISSSIQNHAAWLHSGVNSCLASMPWCHPCRTIRSSGARKSYRPSDRLMGGYAPWRSATWPNNAGWVGGNG